jgi:hypothetical protein
MKSSAARVLEMPAAKGVVSAADRAEARKLVKTVVIAQGNIFIRELLRAKKLPMGATKETFETNLLEAIDGGKLTLADIKEWLAEVEGWGDQHIYLFHLTEKIVSLPHWKSPEAVRNCLPETDRKLWKADSLEFPEQWNLTSISFESDVLTYVWHERYTTLLPRPKMDRREKISGDWYRFKANLERPDRAVMRFVLHLKKRVAALFMQIPAEGEAHQNAKAMVRKAIEPLMPWDALGNFDASSVIKNLDQMALNDPAVKVKPHKSRLSAANNYVEFASTSQRGVYTTSLPVLSVRKAVKPANFLGDAGVFFYDALTPTQQTRPVQIEVSGKERRIKVRAQLAGKEIWDILDLLLVCEQEQEQEPTISKKSPAAAS